jgi:hypothetical protein
MPFRATISKKIYKWSIKKSSTFLVDFKRVLNDFMKRFGWKIALGEEKTSLYTLIEGNLRFPLARE